MLIVVMDMLSEQHSYGVISILGEPGVDNVIFLDIKIYYRSIILSII